MERSLVEHHVLAIGYTDSHGRLTRRTIEPILLAWTQNRWYVVAWRQLRNAIRWFRLDNVTRADVTRDTFEPRPVAEAGEPPSGAAPVAST